MIVKDLGLMVNDDYKNLDVLKERKIISTEMHNTMKKLNGLRNRIVHDYNRWLDQNQHLHLRQIPERWVYQE